MRDVIGRGNVAELRQWLEAEGVSIDDMYENGNTALHFAAGSEKLEMVRVLLAQGADPWIKDNQGKTLFEVVSAIVTNLEKQIKEGGLKSQVNRESINALKQIKNAIEEVMVGEEIDEIVFGGNLRLVEDCFMSGGGASLEIMDDKLILTLTPVEDSFVSKCRGTYRNNILKMVERLCKPNHYGYVVKKIDSNVSSNDGEQPISISFSYAPSFRFDKGDAINDLKYMLVHEVRKNGFGQYLSCNSGKEGNGIYPPMSEFNRGIAQGYYKLEGNANGYSR